MKIEKKTFIVDGKDIAENKYLSKWGKIVLNLEEGENELLIKANNDWLFQPNTIKVEISDGTCLYRKTYRIRKKRTLTFSIVRK